MSIIVLDQGMRMPRPSGKANLPSGVSALDRTSLVRQAASHEDELRGQEDRLFRDMLEPTQRRQAKSAQDAANAYQSTAKKTSNLDERRRMRAGNLMTSPVFTVLGGVPLLEARTVMRTQNIHHLIVVDSKRHVLGMLNLLDILQANHPERLSAIDVARTKIPVAQTDTILRAVATVMIEEDIQALPVIDDDNVAIGIITRTDLLRLLVNGPNIKGEA